MIKSLIKLLLINFIFFNFFNLTSKADILKKIEINGNDRIPYETIQMFADISIDQNLKDDDINNILKNLYNTNFFKDIQIAYENQILIIDVIEK